MTTTLPHSPTDEQHLISAAIVGGAQSVAQAINAGVTAATFYDADHGLIWSAITDLAERGEPPTMPRLMAALAERTPAPDRERVGPMARQIARLLPTSLALNHAVATCRALQQQRAFRRALDSWSQALTDAKPDETEELLTGFERQLRAIADDRPTPPRSWPQAVDEAIAHLDALMKAAPGAINQGEVSWAFPGLDRVFGPMQPGQLVVVAARPSVGKSSLMRQLAMGVARTGRRVFIASLEVKDSAIVRTLAQAEAGVSYRALRTTRAPDDVAALRAEMVALRNAPITVLDDFGATVAQICAQARLLAAKGNLGLVCIDHLHELLECKRPPRGGNVTDAVGIAVKEFKALAGELNLPVVLLAQLNRGPEVDRREPNLADLRASGDIEQAADKVVLLHRPAENPNTGDPQKDTASVEDLPSFVVWAIQAKGRDDGTARLLLWFDRAIARFRALAMPAEKQEAKR
jgi:replicative DNA helicase